MTTALSSWRTQREARPGLAGLGQISGGTRHLLPDPERTCTQQAMVDGSQQVAAETEQIQHDAVDREQSLRVRGGFEPAHLSLALSRRLVYRPAL